jgi:hypothetical protein
MSLGVNGRYLVENRLQSNRTAMCFGVNGNLLWFLPEARRIYDGAPGS